MTPKQYACLKFIADYIEVCGYAPTQREIAAHLNTTGAQVWKHLRELEKLGCIVRAEHKTRAIAIKTLKPRIRKSIRKTSRYRGVHKRPQWSGWIAQIKRDGEMVYIGVYVREIEAARAWDRYVRKHGLRRRLNFPGAA